MGAIIIQKNKLIVFLVEDFLKHNLITQQQRRNFSLDCQISQIFQKNYVWIQNRRIILPKNLFFEAKIIVYQRVIKWILILNEFGLNIQNISVIDNIVAYMLIHAPSTNIDRD